MELYSVDNQQMLIIWKDEFCWGGETESMKMVEGSWVWGKQRASSVQGIENNTSQAISVSGRHLRVKQWKSNGEGPEVFQLIFTPTSTIEFRKQISLSDIFTITSTSSAFPFPHQISIKWCFFQPSKAPALHHRSVGHALFPPADHLVCKTATDHCKSGLASNFSG